MTLRRLKIELITTVIRILNNNKEINKGS